MPIDSARTGMDDIGREEEVRLPDARAVRIRPLHGCEMRAVRDFYDRLTPRTRYLRFFSSMPTLPDSLLRLLACADGRRRLSIVAEECGGEPGALVALATVGAVDDESAEVALVVRDDWQGRGVGTALAARMLEMGEAQGFRRFIAHIQPENVGIRAVMRRLVDVLSARTSGGVVELAFVPHRRAIR